MKSYVWKPFRDLHLLDKHQFLIQRFFEQSATQTNNLLCYWPTCPKFQVFIFRLSEVDELTYEHWAKKLLWENISTPIFPQFYDMYWIKVCCQEFWSILPGLNIRFEQSKYENPAQWLHVKNWFKVARYDKSYTCFLGWWIQTSGLVAKASCSESGYTALSIIVLLQFRQICLYWQVFNS